ncbi:MAG TPA: DUF2157 domain-containing protein [Opitutus sp.]|nr:DUF2157 domain-containing protein [Opitutus sp.]
MKSFEQKLAELSPVWVREGLITDEQRERLLARHPAEIGGGGRFVAILATFGGIMVAAGLALVIASHWQAIADGWKIAGLIALLVGTHLTGWRLRIAPASFPRTGEVFFMIGCVMFLLGIALVSQIYHLNSRPATGVMIWWLGIAGLPWIVRVKSAQLVSLVGLLIWLGMEAAANDSWFCLRTEASGHGAERLHGVAFFFLGATLALSGLALRRSAYARFASLHELLGLLVANAALFFLSFSWSRNLWWNASAVAPRPMPFVVLLVVLGAIAVWAWRWNRPDVARIGGWLALGLVPACGFLFAVNDPAARWWWGAAASVALFFLNVGMVRAGLASGRESWINLGVAFVALNVFARYVDLFASMLEGGLFFVITGLIVLGLGVYLERKRRALVARAREAK